MTGIIAIMIIFPLRAATVLLLVLATSWLTGADTPAHPASNLMWYDQPAKVWMTEALPIGGGSLGGMLFGQVEGERIQFNDITLWTGNDKNIGAYQAFGDLLIDLPAGEATGYRRELDLDQAIQRVTYHQNGAAIERTAFSSHPAGVLVWRMQADKPVCTGRLWLSDMHKAAIVAEGANHLRATGTLNNGMNYEAQVLVLAEGGTVATDATPHNPGAQLPGVDKLDIPATSVTFNNCRSVTVILAAGTDYVQDYAKKWRGPHPHAAVTARLETAAKKPFVALRDEHVADYRSLYRRFTLDLGHTSPGLAEKPTFERLTAHTKLDVADPDLEEMLVNFGRYLMISCSRPGGLPANLQGLWNNSNNPPWLCDYHTNINIQMNYWPALPTNLADCNTALTSYIDSLREVRTIRTKEKYGNAVRGWTVQTATNAMGGNSYKWNPPGSAWYAQHMWEHYAFTRDRAYLEKTAYPMIKEICEFWEDHLKQRPDGTLVTPDGWSPEHGPENAEGISYDTQIVYDLFTNYMDAADALGVDKAYRATIADMRSRLLKPKIGKWGQLQEWEQDIDVQHEAKPHRHVSHLFGLYPGRQFSPLTTPELAKAAEISLRARGDGGTGWARAWKINFWARFLDGDHAYLMLRYLMTATTQTKMDVNNSGGIYPNLFDAHPPFQIDGNFGAAAGVAEMLVQSQSGQVVLLPALPKAWPTGSVHGICARGGFVLDLDWKGGALTRAVVRSTVGGKLALRLGSKTVTVQTDKGQEYVFDGSLARSGK
jgi:alpha-L-fucosidase 2